MEDGTKVAAKTPKVLIVVSGDGYIEAFTEDNVSVRIVQTAYNGRASIGTKVERLCKEYARRDLPETWREVWTRGSVVAAYMFRKLFLSDLHKAEMVAKTLRDLPQLIGQDSKPDGEQPCNAARSV